jgi:hypothetical protein
MTGSSLLSNNLIKQRGSLRGNFLYRRKNGFFVSLLKKAAESTHANVPALREENHQKLLFSGMKSRSVQVSQGHEVI